MIIALAFFPAFSKPGGTLIIFNMLKGSYMNVYPTEFVSVA
jgi:hypothetical protein